MEMLSNGSSPLRDVRRARDLADNVLAVDSRIAALLPEGGLRKGSVALLRGAVGSGVYSLLSLVITQATRDGTWVALLNIDDFGYGSLVDCGVNLDRVVVVRDTTTAARSAHILLESFPLVVSASTFSQTHALRLAARARERSAVFIVVERGRSTQRATGPLWKGRVDISFTLRHGGWHMARDDGKNVVRREQMAMTVTHRGIDRAVSSLVV